MIKYHYIKVISLFSIVFSLLVAEISYEEVSYIDPEVLNAVSQISTKKILEYENIALLMLDQNDRSRFYSIMGIEIQRRIKELDQKFDNKKLFYTNKINMFEENLNLPEYINKIPKVDLDELSIINNQLYYSNSYIENKKNVDLVAKIYRKKLMIYRQSLKNYRNYFIALDKLYYCISPIDFKESLDIYNKVIKHLFY